MPPRAINENGENVNAADVSINEQGHVFYCITPDCPARMSIVNVGNVEQAFFRRRPSSPYHISAQCVRDAIVFDNDRHDERLFNLQNAFQRLFNRPEARANNHGGGAPRVVGRRNIPIRTLRSIYEMCVTRQKDDLYNNYRIGDFFADEENYNVYNRNLQGCVIVECSFYKKEYGQPALLFNYPTNYHNEHNYLRLVFDNDDDCWNYYNKFKNCHHTEPIVIAGDWTRIEDNANYQAECLFYSDRQIYVVR